MTGIEVKGPLGQIKLLEKPLDTLKRSRYGRVVTLVGLSVLLGVFILVSILGGILAGIAALLAILSTLIYVIYPYVKIETINPASRGIPKLLGKRAEDYTLDEGATIVIKGVPFIGGIFEFESIHVGVVNLDFPVKVRDENNFELEIDASIAINAHPDKLMEFYDKGGAHGVSKETGETNKEKEGNGGIADLIIDMTRSSMIMTAKELNYSKILAAEPSLGNNALKKITKKEDVELDALTPDKPYYVKGLGTQILNFVIKDVIPLGKLKELFDRQAQELAEGEFRRTDTEVKRMIAQEMLGMTDDEFEEYKRDNPTNLEDIYLILTALEREEELLAKGLDVKPGDAVLKIRLGRLLGKGINFGDILSLLSKLKGGK